MYNKITTTVAPPKSKTLKCKNKKNRRRRHHNSSQCSHQQKSNFQAKKWHFNKEYDANIPNTSNENSAGFELWRKTYETIISWQSEHQVNYWRNQALNFRNVNKQLWEKLQKYENNEEKSSSEDEDKSQEEYETSSSDSDDNIEQTNVDENYLKFLEITKKHQDNLKTVRKLDSDIKTSTATESSTNI